MSHEYPDDDNGETAQPIPDMGVRRSVLSDFFSTYADPGINKKHSQRSDNRADNNLSEIMEWSGVFSLFIGV